MTLTNKEILECSISIINFINADIESIDDTLYTMNSVLLNYGYIEILNMEKFTYDINEYFNLGYKLKISYDIDDDIILTLHTKLIRDIKLKSILKYDGK